MTPQEKGGDPFLPTTHTQVLLEIFTPLLWSVIVIGAILLALGYTYQSLFGPFFFELTRDMGFALVISAILGGTIERATHESIRGLATQRILETVVNHHIGPDGWEAVQKSLIDKGVVHEDMKLILGIEPDPTSSDFMIVRQTRSYKISNRLPSSFEHHIRAVSGVTKIGQESTEFVQLVVDGKEVADSKSPNLQVDDKNGFTLDYTMKLESAGNSRKTYDVKIVSQTRLSEPFGTVFTLIYPTKDFTLEISTVDPTLSFDTSILHPAKSDGYGFEDYDSETKGRGYYRWKWCGFLFPGAGCSVNWYRRRATTGASQSPISGKEQA